LITGIGSKNHHHDAVLVQYAAHVAGYPRESCRTAYAGGIHPLRAGVL
jgi:hypothetical protein